MATRKDMCGNVLRLEHGHRRHGDTTATYRAWIDMRRRCDRPTHQAYAHYGGRGITVCERWNDSFTSFVADMGICPTGLTLERNDNNGNYEASNCRWATRTEQVNNRRVTRYLTHAGRTQSMSQWAQETGLLKTTLRERLMRGWTDSDAITKPVRKIVRK